MGGMLSIVFCGEFDELFNKLPTLSKWACLTHTNEEAMDFFNRTPSPHLLFITKSRLDCCADKLMKLKSMLPALTIVMVYSENDASDNLKSLKSVPVVDHLIPMWSAATNDLLTKLETPEGRESFLKSRESVFLPKDLENPVEKTLRHVDDCFPVYNEVMDYTEKLKCFSGFSEIIATATSELLTNAFYNGKRDPATGEAVTADRQIKFGLDPHEFVKFKYGKKDNFFWLSVTDSFGSLDRATLLKALERAATERTPRMDTVGGAGLGLLMLFEWASDLSFSLTPGKSTVVACRFKLCRRQKEFDSEASSIHIFTNG